MQTHRLTYNNLADFLVMSRKKIQGEQALFESTFGIPAMQEEFNKLAAIYIQEQILPSEPPTPSMSTAMAALANLVKLSKGGNSISVCYKKAKNSNGKGRWFACSAAAMQSIPKKIRHTICKDLLIDLDFVNSQPTILSQLCAQLDISHELLADYVDRREAILEEMLERSPQVNSRKDAKEIIIKMLNGGQVSLQNISWWTPMHNEFQRLAKEVATHVKHKEFYDAASSAGKVGNFHAKVMNSVLCHHENRCLEALYNFLVDKGCILDGQCSLVFDGIMVLNTEHNQACLAKESFLEEASQAIKKDTGFKLDIKMKDFTDGYELPEGYKHQVFDMILIEKDEDAKAAAAFLEKHPEHLIKCDNRVFWYDEGIYTDDKSRIQDGIISSLKTMKIYMKGSCDQVLAYSSSTKHLYDCMKLILADNCTIQRDFIERLWFSNLRFLAFEDGVYSFESKQLMPYPVEGVFFTHKINRKFPAQVDQTIRNQLVEKVLKPILPDEQQRAYFLHCLARALAGEIYDKKWYICVGERNSGKGVLCELMSYCFQDFVQTINSENLVYCR